MVLNLDLTLTMVEICCSLNSKRHTSRESEFKLSTNSSLLEFEIEFKLSFEFKRV